MLTTNLVLFSYRLLINKA